MIVDIMSKRQILKIVETRIESKMKFFVTMVENLREKVMKLEDELKAQEVKQEYTR